MDQLSTQHVLPPEPTRFVRVVSSIEWAATLTDRVQDAGITVVMHPELVPIEQGLSRLCCDWLVLAVSEESLPKTIEQLQWLQQNRPGVRAVVVGEAAVRYRWWFMEAGAVATFGYVWQAAAVAKLAKRHFIATAWRPKTTE